MPVPVLGQNPVSTAVSEVLTWLLVALGIMVLGATVAMILYRRLMRRWRNTTPPTGFTLDQLRQLRDQGQLTEQEYQRARQAVLAQIRSLIGKSLSDTDTHASDDPQIR